jgi:hypothetical protein
MLLNILTHVPEDPKLAFIESMFGTIKRLSVLFNTGPESIVEIKLLEHVEMLAKKFVQDGYQFKIDRVTMKIITDLNRILEKHSKKTSKCSKDDDTTDDDTTVCSSGDGY